MISTDKNYRPWGVPWLLQRIIILIKGRRLPQPESHRQPVIEAPAPVKQTAPAQIVMNEHTVLQSFLSSIGWTDVKNFPLSLPVGINEDDGKGAVINTYFDRIFVVNLPGRSDRRLKMIQMLARLNIRAEIFFADWGYDAENLEEYGKYLDIPLLSEGAHPLEIRYRKKMIFSPGAWGYLKTYIRLLEHAKEKGYKRILCLDDDVLFHHDFHRHFEEAIQQIPPAWKLLYLGATQHKWEPLEKVSLNQELSSRYKGLQPYYHPHYTDGTFAIGIDCSVYDTILGEIRKMNCSVDSGAMRQICQEYPGSCFVLLPNLIVANVMESDITHSRDQEVFANKMRWNMTLYDFPFGMDLVSVLIYVGEDNAVARASILSLVGQTYPNLELVLADFTPEGLAPEYLEGLHRKGLEVKHLRCSAEEAEGKAFSLSTGKFIVIHDCREISLPARVEKLLEPLCTGQAEVVFTRSFRSDKAIGELDTSDLAGLVRSATGRPAGELPGYQFPPASFTVSTHSAAVSRETVERQGLSFREGFIVPDILSILPKTSNDLNPSAE